MPANNWTDEQKNAIDTHDRDLLISAAAGSGKTAVLTQNIIKRITDAEHPCDITDFLIVTFTKAAAGELRERLYRAVSEESARNPGNARLRRQLYRIPLANISTIDSYCYKIVRDCFQKLNLNARIRIADEAENAILQKRVMNEVIDEFYAQNPCAEFPSFLPESPMNDYLSLVELFSGKKNDIPLVESLLSIYGDMMCYPLPFERQRFFMKQALDELERYYQNPARSIGVFETSHGKVVYEAVQDGIQSALALLRQIITDYLPAVPAMDKVRRIIEGDVDTVSTLSELVAKTVSYDAIRDALYGLSFPTLRFPGDCVNKEKIKLLRDAAKACLKQIRDTFFLLTEDEIFGQLAMIYRMNVLIDRILARFSERLTQEKRKHAILSFSDLAHLSFEALVEKESYSFADNTFALTEYAQKLSGQFQTVYIDEYQDVNHLQDAIFRAIGGKGTRFMVGDVKQSIYGFRGAVPEIFKDYRNAFSPFCRTVSSPQTLFLSHNFRCDRPIIDFVNRVFSQLMPEEYREEDRLVFSKGSSGALPVELCILNSSAAADPEAEEEEEEQDDLLEGVWIAEKINSLTNSGFLTEKGEPLRYGDIAILAPAAKALNAIRPALYKAGIPADEGSDSSFFEKSEILLILSLLHTVNNPTKDIYLASVLTSVIFSFTDDDLMKIRYESRDMTLYSSLLSYRDKETGSEEIKSKIRYFLDRLALFHEKSVEYPVGRFVWFLYQETSLFSAAAKMKGGRDTKNTLLSFYSLAVDYEKKYGKSLALFLSYLNDLSENKQGVNAKSGTDSVRLLTIHKAKGLEFPVCFLSGTGGRYNTNDIRNIVIADENFGRTFKIISRDYAVKIETFARKAAELRLKKKQREENNRVLYVALTRARQKLVITGTCSSPKSFCGKVISAAVGRESFRYHLEKAQSPLESIAMALSGDRHFYDAVTSYQGSGFLTEQGYSGQDFSFTILNSVQREPALSPSAAPAQQTAPTLPRLSEQEWEDVLSWSYPDEILTRLPYKLSVSALHAGLTDTEKTDPLIPKRDSPAFLSRRMDSLGAERGSAMHTFMQFADFENCVKNGTSREAQRLLSLAFLSEEQAALLRHDLLTAFFSSRTYRELHRSPEVTREMRFNIRLPAEYLAKNEEEKHALSGKPVFVVVQGVIDCFYRNEDGTYTVLDYKTDWVKSGADGEHTLRERHSEQLLHYVRAVEEITGKPVGKAVIYSFSLGREIRIL